MLRSKRQILILLSAGMLFSGCQKQEAPGPVLDTSFTKTLNENSFRTVTPEIGTLTVSGEQYGKQYYLDMKTQLFEETEGRVTEVYFHSGDEVKQGDVLAELDTEYRKSHLEELQDELTRAKEDYEVQEKLWQKKIVAAQTELGSTLSNYNTNDHDAKDNEAFLNVLKSEAEGKVSPDNGMEIRSLDELVQSIQGTLPGLKKDIEIGNIGLESQSVAKLKYELSVAENIRDLQDSIAKYERDYGSSQIVAAQDGIVTMSDKLKKGKTLTRGDRVCTIRHEAADLLTVKVEKGALPFGMEVRLESEGQKNGTVYTGHVISSPELCPQANVTGRAEAGLSMIRLDDESVSLNGVKLKAKWDLVSIRDVMTLPKNAVLTDKVNGDYVEMFLDGNIEKRYIDGVESEKRYWVTGGLNGDEKIILRN